MSPTAFLRRTGLAALLPLRLLSAPSAPFTLGPSYPNPVAGGTTIPFTLKEPADVVLYLFDAAGRRIAIFKRAGLAAGSHTLPLNFDALELPPAEYAYQLTATTARGTFSQVRRLVHRFDVFMS